MIFLVRIDETEWWLNAPAAVFLYELRRVRHLESWSTFSPPTSLNWFSLVCQARSVVCLLYLLPLSFAGKVVETAKRRPLRTFFSLHWLARHFPSALNSFPFITEFNSILIESAVLLINPISFISLRNSFGTRNVLRWISDCRYFSSVQSSSAQHCLWNCCSCFLPLTSRFAFRFVEIAINPISLFAFAVWVLNRWFPAKINPVFHFQLSGRIVWSVLYPDASSFGKSTQTGNKFTGKEWEGGRRKGEGRKEKGKGWIRRAGDW